MSLDKGNMINIREIFREGVRIGASDIHITVGVPVMARVTDKLIAITDSKLDPNDTKHVVESILTPEQYEHFLEEGEIDFSFSISGLGRFRCNAFKQRNSYGLVFRIVPIVVPSLESLGIPNSIGSFTRKQRGLVLVTGPTGSGKSTTLASLIDIINRRDKRHIITIEDPIEYLHTNKLSLVNQREVGIDTKNFSNALRAALRQDPDVILVGEMRDLETIATVLTAAETGHLVFSTLHTVGTSLTIDRIVDVFPPHQQQQIKSQLAGVLEGIISQQLVPSKDGSSKKLASEILVSTPAVRNLIREGKTHQIQTIIQTGRDLGMVTMDESLLSLYRANKITRDDLIRYAVDVDYVSKQTGFNGF